MTEMQEFFRQKGRLGGLKRAARLTKKQLSEIGRKGAIARWKNRKRPAVRKRPASRKAKAK